MSLNWGLEKIENHRELCFVDAGDDLVTLNPVTNALIWYTLAVGLGAITEKNAAEFYARVYLVETLDGPTLVGEHGPTRITPEDVAAHVGLYTNVSDETRARWMGRIGGHELDSARRRFERETKKEVTT